MITCKCVHVHAKHRGFYQCLSSYIIGSCSLCFVHMNSDVGCIPEGLMDRSCFFSQGVCVKYKMKERRRRSTERGNCRTFAYCMSSVCVCMCVCVRKSACMHLRVHACVFFFFRFTPRELLSFLHRSLIEGRRDRGRWRGGKGEDGAGKGACRVHWVPSVLLLSFT